MSSQKDVDKALVRYYGIDPFYTNGGVAGQDFVRHLSQRRRNAPLSAGDKEALYRLKLINDYADPYGFNSR